LRTRSRAGVLAVLVGLTGAASGQGKVCLRAVIDGEVAAGQRYERAFTPGLKFLLEPIASGWIVRVLAVDAPRGPHDYAELATPPYRSVTPLAIGTDFSFRAQDAVGWNPRRFRYAATAADFRAMGALYSPAAGGDGRAAEQLAELAAKQPEVELKIVEARLAPGTNDQARMAAAVAAHFGTTPHTVESTGASPLGKVTWMRFRAAFDLVPGVRAARGVAEEKRLCSLQTTEPAKSASHFSSPVRKK
jgi:hypothetical protein